MAPVGAWLAVRGEISLVPLVIGAANTLWVAGFDIIYGAQDYAFDTANGINSIPARFGVKNGLSIAKGFHMVTLLLLILLGFLAEGLGILYFIGHLIIGVLFIIEHRMVSPENLTNVKLASYSINQLISVTFLVFGILATITPY
jgi:4-hydroxybenzoate polyprenyltransferase